MTTTGKALTGKACRALTGQMLTGRAFMPECSKARCSQLNVRILASKGKEFHLKNISFS